MQCFIVIIVAAKDACMDGLELAQIRLHACRANEIHYDLIAWIYSYTISIKWLLVGPGKARLSPRCFLMNHYSTPLI